MCSMNEDEGYERLQMPGASTCYQGKNTTYAEHAVGVRTIWGRGWEPRK